MEGHRFYPEEELAELIRGLDRAEDQHAFAEDVLVTYPYLAERYTKVCPTRCDLATAARKALDGAYSHDAKLNELREDIALMVRNCVRFNGESHPLAEIAESFEHFAMAQIDAYILRKTGGRRVSSLRLQSSLSQTSEDGGSTSQRRQTVPATSAGPVSSNSHGTTARGHGGRSVSTVIRLPTRKELVDLVQSLIRREDAGAFSVDVGEAYPELRESYAAVCPRQMNLMLMKERAARGYYLHEEDDPMEEGNNTGADRQGTTATTTASEAKQAEDIAKAEGVKAEMDGEATQRGTEADERESGLNNNGATDDTAGTQGTAQVFGDTIATSLLRLREDIELIVSNCIRFNAQVEAWIRLAQSFHRFAHRKVDEFVVRHAARLRGTQSGVDHYVRAASAPVNVLVASTIVGQKTASPATTTTTTTRQQEQPAEVTSALGQSQTAAVTEETTTTTTMAASSRKRGREDVMQQSEKAAATTTTTPLAEQSATQVDTASPSKLSNMKVVPVEVVADREPTIRPTPLQPALIIPATLRRRLVADHVAREGLRLRRLGQRYPLAELISQGTCRQTAKKPECEETKDGVEGDKKKENSATDAMPISAAPTTAITDAVVGAVHEALIDHITETSKADTALPDAHTSTLVCVTAECTVKAVLEHFRRAITNFYQAQRSRPDFDDPFRYAVHDEQMYYDLVQLIRTQFNRLFLPLLLYPREAAEAHAWAAAHTIQSTMTGHNSEEEEVEVGVVDWAAEVHYCYLVRFLAQFPQLASLCCASPVSTGTGNASSTPSRDYVLKISKEALVLLQQVTKVTSELLQFVADYEARLVSTATPADEH